MKSKFLKFVFMSLFIVAILYACFLMGKYTYWLVVNPLNRNFLTVFSLIFQIITQAAAVLSAVFTIKKKNKSALALSIIAFLLCAIPYFLPNGSFSISRLVWISQRSLADSTFIIVDTVVMGIMLFLVAVTLTVNIIRLIRNRSPQPPR